VLAIADRMKIPMRYGRRWRIREISVCSNADTFVEAVLAAPAPAARPMDHFDHVWKRYPKRAARRLCDLTLEIDCGEMAFPHWPLVRRQSTLLKLIALIERPSRHARCERPEYRDRASLEDSPFRRQIGIVFQTQTC